MSPTLGRVVLAFGVTGFIAGAAVLPAKWLDGFVAVLCFSAMVVLFIVLWGWALGITP
jgi:hypothetical protein